MPEFVVRPYYPTGGLFGVCLCCYLWNVGGPYRMWPLVAPEAIKDHLRVIMKLDLTDCYAFNPCDGGPVGPYYPINQEKMIFLIGASRGTSTGRSSGSTRGRRRRRRCRSCWGSTSWAGIRSSRAG